VEDAAFDDWLAVLRFRRDKVESVDVSVLADPVYTAEPLFQAGRVLWHVVIDHQVAELEVDAFSCGFRGHAYLRASPENLLCPFPLVGAHAAGDLAGAETPPFEVTANVTQGVPVLRENQELSPAVFQLQKLSFSQALL
jgi:hypothetical protein